MASLGCASAWPADIILGCLVLSVTNTPAYYTIEIITSVKGFIKQALITTYFDDRTFFPISLSLNNNQLKERDSADT